MGEPQVFFNLLLQLLFGGFLLINIAAITIFFVFQGVVTSHDKLAFLPKLVGRFLAYEFLIIGAVIMLIPFYWMVVTAFKDQEVASASPPVWTPSRVIREANLPVDNQGNLIPATDVDLDDPDLLRELFRIHVLSFPRFAGAPATVTPEFNFGIREAEVGDATIVREEVLEASFIYNIVPTDINERIMISPDYRNFQRAWYRPEEATRGQVNFLTYFIVSIVTSVAATTGVLITSALAAFAFARLEFIGKGLFFYIILATMMVPGQVLLIPNFLILYSLGWLDTFAALIVPWLASVFTIFLMRQFFMTIPDSLWDAARIDGASRFRFLWQIVVPLSKPVFITAGIFDFLGNWNSLLWPLIVTSSPEKRTLMVGLQNITEEADAEFNILMAASVFAVLPIVIVFFFLQRFFIEGIAKTGLK